jgi:hypothetical protein
MPSRFTRRATLVGLLAALPSAAAEPQAPPPRETPPSLEQRAARHLERIRQDGAALRAFLGAFPKGADLHTHLTGAVYAESYILWAAELPLCIDVLSFAYRNGTAGPPVTCRNVASERPAAEVLQDPVLHRNVVDALSMRNWHMARGSGHDQFFDTFVKFDAITREGRDASPELMGRAVAEVMRRATLQQVQHLELMVTFDSLGDVPSDAVSWESDAQFEVARQRFAATLAERVANRRRWLDSVEAEARAILRCGTASASPSCGMSVRFLAQVLRGVSPSQVFAQSMLAFELASADSRVAGVNLVMPEDWFVPMRDHDLHMRMFRFLRRLHPGVRVALHAGELALGLVPPEKLGLHVRQAIVVGGAERIGHGTDVLYDADATGLLREMARRRIAVEISLSSSDLILGIRGARHPLRQFLRAGVPVVLATDDEGVARSDLTNEYQRGVEEQGLTYLQLKSISRNSIEFSFLRADDRARLRKSLETAFARFEAALR